jgi:hypothetical protein
MIDDSILIFIENEKENTNLQKESQSRKFYTFFLLEKDVFFLSSSLNVFDLFCLDSTFAACFFLLDQG